MTNKSDYALYKGDELIDIGTVNELAERRNVKVKTIYHYASAAQQRRIKRNGLIAVRLGYEE